MKDLLKQLLGLLPASFKAGKEVLGFALGLLKTLGKLLPGKKTESKAPVKAAEPPKCDCKCKAKGLGKKAGVLFGLAFLAICAGKSLAALQKAKQK
jgi:hypothetical protein